MGVDVVGALGLDFKRERSLLSCPAGCVCSEPPSPAPIWFAHPSASGWGAPPVWITMPLSSDSPAGDSRLLCWAPSATDPFRGLNPSPGLTPSPFSSPQRTSRDRSRCPMSRERRLFPRPGSAQPRVSRFSQHAWLSFPPAHPLLFRWICSDSKSLPSRSLGEGRHVSRCLPLGMQPPHHRRKLLFSRIPSEA